MAEAGSPKGATMPDGGEATNVRVMTRVRPFNKREKEASEKEKKPLKPCIIMRDGNNGAQCCVVIDPETGNEREAFEFDECFWTMPLAEFYSEKPFADQKYVYELSGKMAMEAAFKGFNACIFAYGQTGSGKTYSMLGCPDDPGISPRLVDDLFAEIDKQTKYNPTTKFEVECTFMEVYNEKVRDLFNKKQKEGEYDVVKIRLHPQKGVFIEGLTRKPVATAAQTKLFIERGTSQRAMAETKMNAHSSRSHAIFQIQMTQKDMMTGMLRISTINLVDLAGSEKVKSSMVTGDALKEAMNINQSLSTLRKVIDTLIDNCKLKANSPKRHVPPFRESVLTWVLSDSLGGNSKTMMMTAISPHHMNTEETISTLRYALRAKAIVCSAKVNEEKSAALVENMKEELQKLRMQMINGAMPGMGGAPGQNTREMELELEHREAELKAEVAKMESDFQKKEEAMTHDIAERKQEQEDLRVQVQGTRHKQFADAFRNAFSIKRNQADIMKAQVQLTHITQQMAEVEIRKEELERDLRVQKKQYEDLDESTKYHETELMLMIGNKDKQIGELNAVQTRLKEKVASLELQNGGLDAQTKDQDRRLQKLQQELLALQAASERERHEKEKQREAHELHTKELLDEGENMRKRKEKYKRNHAEARIDADASAKVIAALREDRAAYMTTIRAQQQLTDEHDNVVVRLSKERDDAVKRLAEAEGKRNAREDDVQHLGEALREYQAASAEWLQENHSVRNELDRVQRAHGDLRGWIEEKKFPSGVGYIPPPPHPSTRSLSREGSSGGTAALSPRPSVPSTRTGSPHYTKPSVTRVGGGRSSTSPARTK